MSERLGDAPIQQKYSLRVTGASDVVDEAACLIWSELCPDSVMGDDERPHYEAAAKAVLSLPASLPASPLREITDEMVNLACEVYAEVYHDDDKDMGDAMRAALKAVSPPEQPAADPEGRNGK